MLITVFPICMTIRSHILRVMDCNIDRLNSAITCSDEGNDYLTLCRAKTCGGIGSPQ